MISVLSTTNKYILQPSLLDMHRQSVEWLSSTVFWKREVNFFQKLLTKHAAHFTKEDDKKKIDHFQNLITYYGGEVIDQLASKLRKHEKNLAHMLQSQNETDTVYYKEHKGLMDELDTFGKSFEELKHEFYEFIERSL